MIFWTSAEISPEATVAYRQIINRAEDEINTGLAQPSMDAAWSEWKWAFIAIIISPNLGVEYSERVRRDQKRKVLEFRLKIDFKEFTTSTLAHQVELVFEQLHRSVELMAKWGMVEADLGFLHELLRRVQSPWRQKKTPKSKRINSKARSRRRGRILDASRKRSNGSRL